MDSKNKKFLGVTNTILGVILRIFKILSTNFETTCFSSLKNLHKVVVSD